MAEDSELERLRAARRAEIQQQYESEVEKQLATEEAQATEAQELEVLNTAMRTILTPEARQRLATLEMTRGDVVLAVKRHLFNLFNRGQLETPVSDDILKAVLRNLSESKRESSIRRI